MRVLRLTPHYYFETDAWPSRFDSMGGMQVQITNMSEWLASQRIEQDVLTTGFPPLPRTLHTAEHLTVESVRFLTLPFKSKYGGTVMLNQSWLAGVIRYLRKFGSHKNYDLIHVHASGVEWPLHAAIWAKKYLGLPLVLSIHCSRHFTYHPMNRMDEWRHPRVKRLESKAIREADKVIVLTKKAYLQYAELFPEEAKAGKFEVIGDCIAPYHLKHQGQADCCSLLESVPKLKLHHRVLLFVGRVAHEKGWRTFVNMAERLKDDPNLFFLVCGDGPQRVEMEETLQRLGLEDRFHITGFVSNHQVPCYMGRAEMLVMPSVHEEMGGASLEAIAAGIPIVASEVGGLATLFTHERTALLAQVNDDATFAAHAQRLLADADLCKRLSRQAVDEVLVRFVPEQMFPQLVSLYEKLLLGDMHQRAKREVASAF